ncbi:formylglycine-generating enzyme family protein [Cnuella takakiae]|uniref:formylglycine-generating enzyme family protein n=1 Tax=Cnuella takakiae TaxID=1302690 RepID=UPI0009321461|nr:SUMF1/EgtB/PvdO family nonheme iron enzyme [Cnuella takakiae]OLY94444.1 hypothetical protein BUE76_23095 [Cnuella takakiae]
MKINGSSYGEFGSGTPKVVALKPGPNYIEAVQPITGHLISDTIFLKPKQDYVHRIAFRVIMKPDPKPVGPKVVPIREAVTEDGTEAAKIVKEMLANMIEVPLDSFAMGEDKGPPDVVPAHPVKLSTFYINKYEVTQRQWELLMGSNPSENKCPECPVENITHDDATQFVNRVNTITKRKVRLPTEAEWEYAARKGGTPVDLKSTVWYNDNAKRKTQPVGKLAPNALGIYDLFGNVAEWCRDWYDPAYYKSSAYVNPFGPQDGREKVVRGGSFADGKSAFHPASRQRQSWFWKSKAIGMRLALD